MFKRNFLLSIILTLAVVNTQVQGRQYTRLKGYYRVYQSTNFILSYSIDGMMESYMPLSGTTTEASEGKKGSPFVERKFLGERHRRVSKANGDDTFVRISPPNLERQTLLKSTDSEEHSTRNNGDVCRWADKCGKISKRRWKINGKTEVVTTLEVGKLVGQPKHEIDMSQLCMYDIVARMTQYDKNESYLPSNLLLASQKHQTFSTHYRGEDDGERIDIWSEFYVSGHMTITESELKCTRKEKNSVRTFFIPVVVPPLDKGVAEVWTKIVEY